MTGTRHIYECHLCHKKHRAMYAYLFHLKTQHNIDLIEFINQHPEYESAKCPICGKLRSMNTTSGRFKGKTCGDKQCINKYIELHMITKYGSSSYTQTEEFKLKSQTTKLNKYGHPNYRSKQKNHCRQSLWDMIDSWSDYIVPLFDRSEYKGLFETYKWKCQLCGQEFESTIHATRHIEGHQYDRMPRCFHCFPRIRGTSKEEHELIDFCKLFQPQLKSNDNTLIGKELDIVIPELKLAIEFNGLYWHSTSCPKFRLGRHIKKTELCEKLGYRLIHIWEDDWVYRRIEIESKLKDVLTKCETIPYMEHYDRFWYSPLQFNCKGITIIQPNLEMRTIGRHTYTIDNCGYFSIPPLQ